MDDRDRRTDRGAEPKNVDWIMPTKNPDYGFWGTVADGGVAPLPVWTAAAEFLETRYALTSHQSTALLDSRFGRLLADELANMDAGYDAGQVGARLADISERKNWRDAFMDATETIRQETAGGGTDWAALHKPLTAEQVREATQPKQDGPDQSRGPSR